MSTVQIDRVSYLVGHHHTLDCIEGIDYQILIESDYIVDASENNYSVENLNNFDKNLSRHRQGIHCSILSCCIRVYGSVDWSCTGTVWSKLSLTDNLIVGPGCQAVNHHIHPRKDKEADYSTDHVQIYIGHIE